MPTIERRLKDASFRNKKVSFLVHTPHSEEGVAVQSVMLKDFVVKETRAGHKMVVGRDLAKEKRQDIRIGRSFRPGQKRRKNEVVIRHYRIDRIVPRTLIS